MPDSDLAPWETSASRASVSGAAELTMAEKAAPKVPPPPMDIALRTMESDMKSILETGGSHPKAISISLDSKDPASPPKPPTISAKSRNNLITILIVSVTVLILIGLGFFFWKQAGRT